MAALTNGVLCLEDGGMDLEATLFCGQSFAWQPADGPAKAQAFYGVAGAHAALAWQDGAFLHLLRGDGAALTSAETDFWRDYFALEEDYAGHCAALRGHRQMAACVDFCPGIRVLHQPFWDVLLCFILSQNNNIPRITGIAGRLRAHFGPALPGGGHGYPAPEALAGCTLAQLEGLRAGFRAKYLLDAARRVAGGELREEALRAMPTDEAQKALMTINGVGPKVADCVLLYGLGRSEVAPMDVWMKKAMAAYFPKGMPRCAKGREGIAQQFIFHWVRHRESL